MPEAPLQNTLEKMRADWDANRIAKFPVLAETSRSTSLCRPARRLVPFADQVWLDIRIVACGTSWHAGLVGEYLIEEFARIPVEVEYASELRYRNPPLDEGTLLAPLVSDRQAERVLEEADAEYGHHHAEDHHLAHPRLRAWPAARASRFGWF